MFSKKEYEDALAWLNVELANQKQVNSHLVEITEKIILLVKKEMNQTNLFTDVTI